MGEVTVVLTGNTMADQIFDNGDQYVAELVANETVPDTSWDLGLFNQTTDSLSGSATETDITTEPSDGNYSRVSVSLPGGVNTNNGILTIPQQVFDVDGTTAQDVDAVFAVGGAGLVVAWVVENTPVEIGGSITQVTTGELTVTWD